MTAKQIYLEAIKSCREGPGAQADQKAVGEEIGRLEALFDDLAAINRLMVAEAKRHHAKKARITDLLAKVQAGCRHQYVRATAECDEVCMFCGHADSGYRRS